MKLLHIPLLITIALIFASCHSHENIVIVQPVNPHCACESEEHAHKDDHAGCPHHLPDDSPHCQCGVGAPEHEDSAVQPPDESKSCGCVFRSSDTSIRREVRETALKDLHELHFSCGVKATDDDGTVLLPDEGKSCSCGVAAVQTPIYPPGVPIEVIEHAFKDMPDTVLVPLCQCGIDRTDEGDAGLSMKQRKAILEQGLKLLEGDAKPQPEAGEDDDLHISD